MHLNENYTAKSPDITYNCINRYNLFYTFMVYKKKKQIHLTVGVNID